jgi:hypothetical protein
MSATITTFRLAVVPEPEPASETVLIKPDPADKEPFIVGPDDVNMACGCCEAILVKGLKLGRVRRIVFLCPNCGAYNLATGHE